MWRRRTRISNREPLTGHAPGVDEAEEQRRAMDAALSFLSYRPRTVYEVRRKLRERSFAAGIVERSLDRLTAVGLVNDESFVEFYVRDRITHRPMGVRRLTDELFTKGIKSDFARPIIARIFAEEQVDERELAARAAGKKLRGSKRGTALDPAARRRLAGYLARRGFAGGIVREIIDDLVSQE